MIPDFISKSRSEFSLLCKTELVNMVNIIPMSTAVCEDCLASVQTQQCKASTAKRVYLQWETKIKRQKSETWAANLDWLYQVITNICTIQQFNLLYVTCLIFRQSFHQATKNYLRARTCLEILQSHKYTQLQPYTELSGMYIYISQLHCSITKWVQDNDPQTAASPAHLSFYIVTFGSQQRPHINKRCTHT